MTETKAQLDADRQTILSQIQTLKQSDLLNVLNCAYIAQRFFGKSGSWFSQKLNNHLKNGQPAQFTQEELKTLSNALYTLSIEIAELADEIG